MADVRQAVQRQTSREIWNEGQEQHIHSSLERELGSKGTSTLLHTVRCKTPSEIFILSHNKSIIDMYSSNDQ
jgi:hypothetical protein